MAAMGIMLAVSCSPDSYIVITGYAQGGTYSVKLNLRTPDGRMALRSPEVLKDSLDAMLSRVDNSLSGYNSGSILSRFNRGETVFPDDIFCDMYARSREIYEESGATVDVAAAPLFDAWGFGFKTDSLPSSETVEALRAACGMARLKADMRSALAPDGSLSPRELLLSPSDLLPRLNFNAVAQGYSCDLIAAYLRSLGIEDMLIDVGGEIYCSGLNPAGKSWRIGIDRPVDGNMTPGADLQAVFEVKDAPCGVVTSGNYRKFYVADGKKYSHTVDPRTGYPVRHNLLCATVLAPDATLADGFATACMVMGLDEARGFILSRPDMEACLVYDEDGQMKIWTSPRFEIQ